MNPSDAPPIGCLVCRLDPLVAVLKDRSDLSKTELTEVRSDTKRVLNEVMEIRLMVARLPDQNSFSRLSEAMRRGDAENAARLGVLEGDKLQLVGGWKTASLFGGMIVGVSSLVNWVVGLVTKP